MMNLDNKTGYLNDEFKKGKFVEFNVKDIQKALKPLFNVVRKGEYKQYFYIFSRNKKLEILFQNEFFKYFAHIEVLNQDNSKYLEDLFTVDAYDFIYILKKIPKCTEKMRFYKEGNILILNIDFLTDTAINDYTVDRQEIEKVISNFKILNKKEKIKFDSKSFKDFLYIITHYRGNLNGYFYIKDKTAYYIHRDNDSYYQRNFSFVINKVDLPDMVISTKHLKFFYDVCKNFDKNILSGYNHTLGKLELRLFKRFLYIKISDNLELILNTVFNTESLNPIFEEYRTITQNNLDEEISPLLKNVIWLGSNADILLNRLEIFIKQNEILSNGIIRMKIEKMFCFYLLKITVRNLLGIIQHFLLIYIAIIMSYCKK